MNERQPVFVDTHAHLNLDAFRGKREDVAQRAADAGVPLIINVGVDLPTSRLAVELAEQYEGLHATAGVHPHDADACDAETIDALKELCDHPKVVAVGEAGLDFFRDLSPRPKQIEVLRRMIRFAREVSLPLIVHDREAHEEVLSTLAEEGASEVGGVLHCYSAGPQLLSRTMDLGFLIGIDGPVTYTNADALREVAARVPLDRLLLETDCPYLAPKGRDRNRNEPAFIPDIAAKIAEVRSISVAEVAQATTSNALRLFPRLSLPAT